jgi:Baseplate J-like protein
VRVDPGTQGWLPGGTQLLTRIDEPLRGDPAPHPVRLTAAVADEALEKARAVFETVEGARVRSELNEIPIYTWGNRDCCLPRGATAADLVGDLVMFLRPGDFLLLEEVRGADSGLPQDADPAHRAVVRLDKVYGATDVLRGVDLTRVEWNERDALKFPLCVATPEAEGEGPVAVARGNLVLADHGRTVSEWYPAEPSSGAAGIRSRPSYRFTLRRGPVSARIREREERGLPESATSILGEHAHEVVPEASIDVYAPTGLLEGWDPVPNLLESESFHRHFVVEAEDDGRATIRFGNRGFGLEPPDDSFIHVRYRVGVGREGNIGAEALAHAIDPGTEPDWPALGAIRNPLPASGGVDPESARRVKELAPTAFRAVQFRAVTADDYARIAERHQEVSRAVASFRWTGSWHTVYVAIDPKGVADPSPELKRRVRNWVYAHTQAGYDLEIEGPVFVPLEIEITICVSPDHFRADVEQAVLAELGTGALPRGRTGFFDPDKFTFGQPLYLSVLYSALEKIEGVDSAVVTVFKRYAKVAAGELESGVISAGRNEILRLDNDSNFPERGQIRLTMAGGK